MQARQRFARAFGIITFGLIVVGCGAYYVTLTKTSPQIQTEKNSVNSDSEQKEVIQSNHIPTQWKTYSNRNYGFSINYPSDWKVNDQSYTYQNKNEVSIEFSSPVRNFPQYKQYALDNVRFSIQIYFKDGKKSIGWKQIYKENQRGDQAVATIISNDIDLKIVDAQDYALAQQIFDSAN